jgi:hypothetical protein
MFFQPDLESLTQCFLVWKMQAAEFVFQDGLGGSS